MNKPVVLITGALTGIGRATALAFAKDGARLVVSGRREAEGKALEAELRRLGAEAAFIPADVRRDDEVSNLVDKTVARFGRLDVAVNNAGTEGQVGPITDQTAESYAATFDTNVLGVILSMKHEVRVMQGQGSGSIIRVSIPGRCNSILATRTSNTRCAIPNCRRRASRTSHGAAHVVSAGLDPCDEPTGHWTAQGQKSKTL